MNTKDTRGHYKLMVVGKTDKTKTKSQIQRKKKKIHKSLQRKLKTKPNEHHKNYVGDTTWLTIIIRNVGQASTNSVILILLIRLRYNQGKGEGLVFKLMEHISGHL